MGVIDLFTTKPKWTYEPSTDAIQEVVRRAVDVTCPIEVRFLAQGVFNKLYTVRIDSEEPEYVMRVALPVDPHFKTESEAATLKFIANTTGLPVPNVIAYSSDQDDELGFEWILMQRMPGEVLEEKRKSMPWDSKVQLVKVIVGYIADLRKHSFSGIGNIYLRRQPSNLDADNERHHSAEYEIGRVAAMDFFWKERPQQDIPRGPFTSSADFLDARLLLVINECHERLQKVKAKKEKDKCTKQSQSPIRRKNEDHTNSAVDRTTMGNTGKALTTDEANKDHSTTDVTFNESRIENADENGLSDRNEDRAFSHDGDYEDDMNDGWTSNDEEEEEDAQESLDLALELRKAIPAVFPPSDNAEPEQTSLFHHDLSLSNMLVTTAGHPSAILDWECVTAVPDWKACQLPEFLVGRPRKEALSPGTPEVMPEGLSAEEMADWTEEQG